MQEMLVLGGSKPAQPWVDIVNMDFSGTSPVDLVTGTTFTKRGTASVSDGVANFNGDGGFVSPAVFSLDTRGKEVQIEYEYVNNNTAATTSLVFQLLNSTSNDGMYHATSYPGNTANELFSIYEYKRNAPDSVQFPKKAGTSHVLITSTQTDPTRPWVFVWQVYVDGTKVATLSSRQANGEVITNGYLYLGQSSSGYYLTGQIKSLKIKARQVMTLMSTKISNGQSVTIPIATAAAYWGAGGGGGGGGGATSGTFTGGKGGNGGMSYYDFSIVTAGTTFSVTGGAGGAGGAVGGTGGTPTNTVLTRAGTTLYTVGGGGGGSPATATANGTAGGNSGFGAGALGGAGGTVNKQGTKGENGYFEVWYLAP